MHKIVAEKIVSDFKDLFEQRLASRYPYFEAMIKFLLTRYIANGYVVIIETGTARQKDNWQGDGQSTLVWEWLLSVINGSALSIDNNEEAVKTIQEQLGENSSVQVLLSDSVQGLNMAQVWLRQCDLLYMDSFDLDRENPGPASFHHMMELATCYAALPKSTMIVVDDCVSDTCGKHLFLKKFFEQLKIDPVFTGYQTGWVKP